MASLGNSKERHGIRATDIILKELAAKEKLEIVIGVAPPRRAFQIGGC